MTADTHNEAKYVYSLNEPSPYTFRVKAHKKSHLLTSSFCVETRSKTLALK
jgi:hypothetical protein